MDSPFASNWQSEEAWSSLPNALEGSNGPNSKEPTWSWQAAHDDAFLYVHVESAPSEQWQATEVVVLVEPTHVHPRHTFRVNLKGKRINRTSWLGPDPLWEAAVTEVDRRQTFRLRIPLDTFDGEADPTRPMRFNVEVTYLSRDKKKQRVQSWAPHSEHRIRRRLGYAWADPAEMGWLLRR